MLIIWLQWDPSISENMPLALKMSCCSKKKKSLGLNINNAGPGSSVRKFWISTFKMYQFCFFFLFHFFFYYWCLTFNSKLQVKNCRNSYMKLHVLFTCVRSEASILARRARLSPRPWKYWERNILFCPPPQKKMTTWKFLTRNTIITFKKQPKALQNH